MKIAVVEKNKINHILKGIDKFKQFSNIKDIIKSIEDNMEYKERANMETDFNYVQPIPYAIIKYKDKYLVYTRTKKSGEGRLHNKISIGIGGHVDNNERIITALYRELYEELFITPENISLEKPIGLIYDDSVEVSSVHLGIVYILRIRTNNFILSPEISDVKFVSEKELQNLTTENWSEILIKNKVYKEE